MSQERIQAQTASANAEATSSKASFTEAVAREVSS